METINKHTPGPWSQFDNGGTVPSGHAYGTQYADVVWGPRGPGYGAIADCSGNGQASTPETIANARLIAAAPDLLAALKEIATQETDEEKVQDDLPWTDFQIAHRELIQIARAAILKAKGGAA